MHSPLLDFAKSFAKFKSNLSRSTIPDHQLLQFIQFWPQIKSKLTDKSYATYVDEWLAILPLVTQESIFDLMPDELEILDEILKGLASFARPEPVLEELKKKLKLVQVRWIKLLFYLGELERALELSTGSTGDEQIPKYDPSLLDNLDSYECLHALTNLFLQHDIGLGKFLKRVLDEWEAERSGESTDLAWCIFVETDGQGSITRGRLRRLKGIVEPGPSSEKRPKKTDTVTFDNQVKSPDDPLIGSVYKSLEATRNLLGKRGFPKRLIRSYRSFYSIEERQYAFTGDSIALAASIIAYAQLLKGEVLKEKRRISSAVAFTGGIDETDRLLPVNKETLSCKIQRAFSSHLKSVVLPEENLSQARAHLEKLGEKYPRRRLRIEGFGRLSEVIDSRDVLFSQKMWTGEFIARKAYKQVRSAKVQIPLLMVVIYFLICLFYPKAWIGFDWNPAKLELTQTGFFVTNARGRFLWRKANICLDLTKEQGRSVWLLENLDDDPENEVLFLPEGSARFHCKSNAHLLVYDHNGDLLFNRQCKIMGEYPGDDSDSLHYLSFDVQLLDMDSKKVIMTTVAAEYPARAHHKFWSLNGDLLGWYVQAGYGGTSGPRLALDNQSRLLLFHTNNRLKKVGFYALYPDSACGVSPPYSDSEYDLSWVRRGSQLCYISFPRCELASALGGLYDYPYRLKLEVNGIRADISLRSGSEIFLSYFIDGDFRVCGVSPSDSYIRYWDSLAVVGRLRNPNRNQHLNDLLNQVAYWTDSGWVTEGQLRAAGK